MNHRIADLFALLWPVLILLTLYTLAAPFIAPFINLFLLFGLVFAVDLFAFYLYRSASENRDNSFFMLLRSFVFLLLLCLVLYKLISGELIRRLYTPVTPGSLTVLFSCAAGWGLTLFFAKALVYREKLVFLFAPFDKNDLAAKTRQYSYELQEMKGLTEQIRLFPLLFTLASLILLPLLSIFSGKIFTYQVVVILFLLVFCLSFIFQTRGMDEELLLLSEGIRLKGEWQSMKVRRFFLLLILLAVPAFALSRSELNLPSSLLTDFFAWLGKLFTREPGQSVPLPEMPILERSAPPMSPPLMMLEDVAPRTPLLSDRTKEIIKRILIGSGIGAFILFLLYPLVSRSGRSRGKGLIREGISELSAYLSQLAGLLFRSFGKRSAKPLLSGGILFPDRKGKGKKEKNRRDGRVKDLPSAGRVVKAFNRLCRWGKKRNILYRTGLSPSDYIKGLGEILPQRNGELLLMARFLDDYFYSTRLIESKEIDDFIQHTAKIISEERKRK